MTRSALVFGFAFVALGTLLLLDEAGVVTAWPILADHWPLLVVLAGVARFVTRPRNVLGGVLLLVVGVALWLWTLGVADSLDLLWPVLLLTLGVWLLTRRRREPTSPTVTSSDDLVVVFDDRDTRVPPGGLAIRSVTTVFGDLDLDLRDAVIDGRARLQVTTIFGDVDVVIPHGWRVTVSGPEVFGDVRTLTSPDLPGDAPVLDLQVLTLFGDLDVRARERDRVAQNG
jgi:hypothetical protein